MPLLLYWKCSVTSFKQNTTEKEQILLSTFAIFTFFFFFLMLSWNKRVFKKNPSTTAIHQSQNTQSWKGDAMFQEPSGLCSATPSQERVTAAVLYSLGCLRIHLPACLAGLWCTGHAADPRAATRDLHPKPTLAGELQLSSMLLASWAIPGLVRLDPWWPGDFEMKSNLWVWFPALPAWANSFQIDNKGWDLN